MNKQQFGFKSLAALTLSLAVAGCYTIPKIDPNGDNGESDLRAIMSGQKNGDPTRSAKVFKDSYLGVRDITEKDKSKWLNQKVTIKKTGGAISATSLMKMFQDRGINIASSLPLDHYSYSGFGVSNVDAETALKLVFGPMGLDFNVDNDRRVVTVTPMRSKTWSINTGNRQASFQTGTPSTGSGSSTSGAGGSSGNTSFSTAAAGGSSGASSSGLQGQSMVTNGSGGISMKDEFWTSLDKELKARLTILMPSSGASYSPSFSPMMPQSLPNMSPVAMNGADPTQTGVMPNGNPLTLANLPPPSMGGAGGAMGAATSSMFSQVQVGTYSLNAETGAITIQAPHWILDSVGEYLDNVQKMYNASLTFEGELLMVSTDGTKTEGFDISSFGNFAKGRYGAVMSNNVLGGISLSFPDAASSIPSVLSSGAVAGSGSLLGIISPLDGLQIFNAYLSQYGKVRTIQKPVIQTTSGVPSEFSRIKTLYYNNLQQTTAGSTTSATVGTQNVKIPFDIGTVLAINPRLDIRNGLVRAQISLRQMVQTGSQQQVEYITMGDKSQQVISQIPTISKMNYSGEALLKDGDLIVLGGIVEDGDETGNEGITGLQDISSIFGKRNQKTVRNTFYFALRLKVQRNS